MTDPKRQGGQRLAGLLAMVVACSIWGLGPLWIRTVLGYLPAASVCLLRLALGGLALLPTLLWYRRDAVWRLLRHPAVWLGGAAMAVNMLAYAAALRHIRPAEVNLLFQVSLPASALLGLVLHGERIPARRAVACAVVLVGVAMVILARDSAAPAPQGTRWLGVVLGLMAGLGASLLQAVLRHLADQDVGLPAQFALFLVTGAVLAALTGGRTHWLQAPDPVFWRSMLWLGVLASGIASMLSYYGIRRISLAQVGVSGAMQPVVTVLVTSLLGEVLPLQALVGGAMVVGGVICSALAEQEAESRPVGLAARAARGAEAG